MKIYYSFRRAGSKNSLISLPPRIINFERGPAEIGPCASLIRKTAVSVSYHLPEIFFPL